MCLRRTMTCESWVASYAMADFGGNFCYCRTIAGTLEECSHDAILTKLPGQVRTSIEYSANITGLRTDFSQQRTTTVGIVSRTRSVQENIH